MSLFMDAITRNSTRRLGEPAPGPRLAVAFCWLIVFSRTGICIHDALGDAALWLYVAACFGYAYGLHVTAHRWLLRLLAARRPHLGIG